MYVLIVLRVQAQDFTVIHHWSISLIVNGALQSL